MNGYICKLLLLVTWSVRKKSWILLTPNRLLLVVRENSHVQPFIIKDHCWLAVIMAPRRLEKYKKLPNFLEKRRINREEICWWKIVFVANFIKSYYQMSRPLLHIIFSQWSAKHNEFVASRLVNFLSKFSLLILLLTNCFLQIGTSS